MPTFKKFEEIQAWKKARIVTRKIYTLTKRGDFSSDFGLRNQSQRAAVSIMANIAEGHGRKSSKDFAHYLNIARGSAIELQSLLYAALDQDYVEEVDFEDIYNDIEEISKMTVSLSRYLQKQG